MIPEVIKYRLWNLALRKNPQTATYKIRASSSTVGTADTFTSYNLLRVCYQPPKLDQLTFLRAMPGTQYATWTILQVDLDNSGAPNPAISYQLVINGQTWIIENVTLTVELQGFECLCRLAPDSAKTF